MKELCNCGKIAQYWYMPGFSDGNPFQCEDCVNRGCDCVNRYVDIDSYDPPLDEPDLPEGVEGKDWMWVEVDKIWCHIDDEGRQYPCCEHAYKEDGWDKTLESPIHQMIDWSDNNT